MEPKTKGSSLAEVRRCAIERVHRAISAPKQPGVPPEMTDSRQLRSFALCWAITTLKSLEQTVDKAIIDLESISGAKRPVDLVVDPKLLY